LAVFEEKPMLIGAQPLQNPPAAHAGITDPGCRKKAAGFTRNLRL